MENYQERWAKCLQMIREWLPKDVKVIPQDDAEWVYQTWFAPITFESFDPTTGELVLRVPDHHVCEYIEHYRMPLWSWVLKQAFSPNVRLGYRIQQPSPDHPEGYISDVSPERPRFSIPDARQQLESDMRRVVGDGFRWMPAYDKVAAWLTDNEGRGLLCLGTPGMGKSTICCDVLPPILGGPDWRRKIPVVQAGELRSRLDELKRARCVVIDDLGKDDRKHYGNQDNSFYELCEASVHGGPLLIITTNLSTTTIAPQFPTAVLYPDSIQHRYGDDVLSRLAACTTVARFEGANFWKSKN